uniref:Hepatocyte growth factor-regulated tyrosine kinase substrate n=1 Tax=Phallusia mammillata TaxID=59560 RepID=A0A6F9DDT7_9ASCI|nr:hepatocyte growth factor-regulated tyrosine kinase substrate L homolog [Phallusia mammillata]
MFRSKSQFERVFEKATSNLLLEPDLDCNMQLCDMIRGGDTKAREAAAIMKSRVLEEKNPHVLFFALDVLDITMKNCGEAMHTEVLTESFLEQIKELVKSSSSENVKNKLLEMIQLWGLAFKDKSDFKVATNLYNIMKAEGYKFPSAPSNPSDMFKSETAPTWKDGRECQKCKTEFSLVQRKHHCRACGGIFCDRCSSKQAIIPKYGIEKEVRVCDACFDKLVSTGGKTKSDSELPLEYLNSDLAKQSQEPPKRDDAAIKEEEELQLALALSLDEQENRNRIRREQINDSVYTTVNKQSTPTAPVASAPQAPVVDPEEDPDLARYMNRSYWDKKKDDISKQNKKDTSQKAASGKSSSKKASSKEPVEEQNTVENEEPEMEKSPRQQENLQGSDIPENEELLTNLRTSVEIFMNRMKSDQLRGRSIANDSTVQTLFQSINNTHPMLIQFMNELEEKRLHQEALQDKLVQLRDARAALDALRTEHAEKMKRAAEEAERQRQIQMVQKLELMRQKKQEYLAYQRQLALQRMQEQEMARQARLEQQKQFIQQRAMQPTMLIAGYNTQYMQQGQPNPGEALPPDAQQGMVSNQYNMYGGYPPSPNNPGMQYSQTAAPTGQYAAGQPNQGYAPPTTYSGNFDPNAYNQQTMAGQHVQQAPQDSYNMGQMNQALPNTGAPASVTVQQQVVATAPPPTPQPAQVPQQMTATHGVYQVPQQQQQPPPPQQQQYYHPGQPQEAQPDAAAHQQTPANLLISFD